MTFQSASIKKAASRIGPAASVAMLLIALWFLHKELATLSFQDVLAHIREVPAFTLLTALAFATCSYLVLTGYDAAALAYLDKDIPYRKAALTAFVAYAVGHNVGLVALSGGAIRYRMYTLAGLSATEIARVIVFVTLTFGLGAAGLLGLSLLLMPTTQTAILNLPPLLISAVGALLLAIPIVYLLLTVFRKGPVRFRSWLLSLPGPSIAIRQIVISIADLMFAAATLYVLIAPNLDIGFAAFLGIYLLAMAAGLVSSIPGGIGVFEAVLVAAFPQVSPAALLGTILIYRLIYYVLPLSLALLLLVGNESRQHGGAIKRTSDMARGWLSAIAPQLIAIAVFLSGVVLLVSGASPGVESRLRLIVQVLPLPVLELSHLIGSVIGVGLLILARGLYQRLHGAFIIALAAVIAGIAASLLKGFDYEEGLILSGVAVLLWLSRDEFYRQGSLVAQRFSVQWAVGIFSVLCISIWIGFISYRHVEYSNELWWQFARDANAPRMLRASVLAAVVALGFALRKIFRGTPKLPETDNERITEPVRAVLAAASSSSANVALLGDKRFLWSADRSAFVMYQVCGDSWIAMGDPVGPAHCHEELAWAFRELVDHHHGRVVFYQVSDKSLALYVDLGLTLAKLGEDARVPLSNFSLQGSDRAELRQALNRAKKNGATFEIVPQANVSTLVTDLRRISESWLDDKSAGEKGFSLGAYSDAYVSNFDCAIVRLNGEIVAFANLWPAPAGFELSIDLMRYDKNAPKGIMDYLFVELIQWGAANSYQWFNLGMAPLSGMEQRPLAPLWHKIGHLIFTHGESFYNFEGLRRYKDKFDPEWSPRYIACPGGWFGLPLALLDVSRLISGGVIKIVGK